MADTKTEMQSVSTEPPNVDSPDVSRFRNGLLAIACLLTILAFAFWLRLPMIVHADSHLDSDLAVDGIVLRQYLRTGQLEGAYPGTPHISTLPVFLSLPAVRVWGDSPASLVFAGTAATLLMIVPVFLLARRAYGTVPAILAGTVLAAGGLGQVWLSARVTGGHMLAAAWLAWIWWIWVNLIARRSRLLWFLFGFVCAVALYSDRIFVIGLAAIGLATLVAISPYHSMVSSKIRKHQAAVFLFSLAAYSIMFNDLALAGGSAYGDQFSMTTTPTAIVEHLRLLFLECLPRLVFGRIPPDGSSGVTFTHPGAIPNHAIAGNSPIVWVMIAIAMIMIVISFVSKRNFEPAANSTAVNDLQWLGPMRVGLWSTTMLTFLAFVLNRNIYNSDNYRYLVLLLPGLGMAVARMTAAGPRQAFRRGLAIAFAALLSLDTFIWQTNVGLRAGFSPSRQAEAKRSDAPVDLVDILKSNPPVITSDFEADYWEVYRALYLADLPIGLGQPFGFFPNRFFPVEALPIQKRNPPRFVVITKSPTSMQILAQIRNEGARRVYASPSLEIYERLKPETLTDPPSLKPASKP